MLYAFSIPFPLYTSLYLLLMIKSQCINIFLKVQIVNSTIVLQYQYWGTCNIWFCHPVIALMACFWWEFKTSRYIVYRNTCHTTYWLHTNSEEVDLLRSENMAASRKRSQHVWDANLKPPLKPAYQLNIALRDYWWHFRCTGSTVVFFTTKMSDFLWVFFPFLMDMLCQFCLFFRSQQAFWCLQAYHNWQERLA